MKYCDGRCLYPADLGLPEFDRGEPAYPDPECALHGWNDEAPLTREQEEEAPPDEHVLR